ncbi:uncharacterized protein MONOS_1376 [Monocercomonoides exilis]|uniref:uncharacterized protein n=1 Tax=Monocercomonoides exilis TaxID=2049356 RepID=UPI0035596201|nr:hypothetical protein MONOS_1376 [Monocercomonoides exilis]|eukprot:MONOS_1376.1-p1 / transcript=MONOS_1376.1 / gene=MONOS_1376 / organism=Monocercomonoides_exilis_PA203 / gene_product=unspecified product / transcript_product=unspecified product / location=Mono_scaffold00024:8462-9925(-) / protein_length=471 / sequence_SO=supercontig / SO=protein_coding / is_pseudo=false
MRALSAACWPGICETPFTELIVTKILLAISNYLFDAIFLIIVIQWATVIHRRQRGFNPLVLLKIGIVLFGLLIPLLLIICNCVTRDSNPVAFINLQETELYYFVSWNFIISLLYLIYGILVTRKLSKLNLKELKSFRMLKIKTNIQSIISWFLFTFRAIFYLFVFHMHLNTLGSGICSIMKSFFGEFLLTITMLLLTGMKILNTADLSKIYEIKKKRIHNKETEIRWGGGALPSGDHATEKRNMNSSYDKESRIQDSRNESGDEDGKSTFSAPERKKRKKRRKRTAKRELNISGDMEDTLSRTDSFSTIASSESGSSVESFRHVHSTLSIPFLRAPPVSSSLHSVQRKVSLPSSSSVSSFSSSGTKMSARYSFQNGNGMGGKNVTASTSYVPLNPSSLMVKPQECASTLSDQQEQLGIQPLEENEHPKKVIVKVIKKKKKKKKLIQLSNTIQDEQRVEKIEEHCIQDDCQ